MTVDQAHRARQLELRKNVAGRLGGLLGAMPTLSQTTLEAYLAAAYPTVAGGQHAAAVTSAGYGALRVHALTRRRPFRDRPVDVAGALERSGVLVTPASSQLVAPVLRAMSVSKDGASLPEALAIAASYAYALSSMDLQAASNVGLDEGAGANGGRISGYQKELAPGCCAWCEETAGETYESAEDVPFHERDQCSVAPVFE